MGDAAAHVWPKSLEAGRVPTIITTLFQCADDSSHDASIQFSKCFAENGELVARGHVCKGRDGKINHTPTGSLSVLVGDYDNTIADHIL